MTTPSLPDFFDELRSMGDVEAADLITHEVSMVCGMFAAAYVRACNGLIEIADSAPAALLGFDRAFCEYEQRRGAQPPFASLTGDMRAIWDARHLHALRKSTLTYRPSSNHSVAGEVRNQSLTDEPGGCRDH